MKRYKFNPALDPTIQQISKRMYELKDSTMYSKESKELAGLWKQKLDRLRALRAE